MASLAHINVGAALLAGHDLGAEIKPGGPSRIASFRISSDHLRASESAPRRDARVARRDRRHAGGWRGRGAHVSPPRGTRGTRSRRESRWRRSASALRFPPWPTERLTSMALPSLPLAGAAAGSPSPQAAVQSRPGQHGPAGTERLNPNPKPQLTHRVRTVAPAPTSASRKAVARPPSSASTATHGALSTRLFDSASESPECS